MTEGYGQRFYSVVFDKLFKFWFKDYPTVDQFIVVQSNVIVLDNNVRSPDIQEAFYTTDKKDEITQPFDEGQILKWAADTTMTGPDPNDIFWKTYPNPVTSVLPVDFQRAVSGHLAIFNSKG